MVAHEAAALHGPGEGALDDPAAAQDDEAGHERHTADGLDCNAGFVFCPGHQPPGVAAVCEDTFDEWETTSGFLQHALATVAVLDIGAVDLDRQQAPIGVGQDVALASMDAFTCIVAFESPFWSAVRTVWLSMIAADGEASRPDRSRSSMTKQ